MPDLADFSDLADRAMAQSGRSHMRPVVEKELLHYDILFGLDRDGLLDELTFQGGTALRLCYGSQRFSEDLDFAGGRDFSRARVDGIKVSLEGYIGQRYGLEVSVREPAELVNDPGYRGLHVDTWQLSIITAPARPDIPRQRIKLEIANVAAYSRIPRSLKLNYDFLPDGYGDTLVLTESLDEIMADKLVSLVNTQRYVRHRDIWDLRWLKQQGAAVNPEWLYNKINDYRIDDYGARLEEMRGKLPTIVHSTDFANEMSRFLPDEVQQRTLAKSKFLDFLVIEIDGLLAEGWKELQAAGLR
jgi:predicted nucleotidyltransferase component of viral defense system